MYLNSKIFNWNLIIIIRKMSLKVQLSTHLHIEFSQFKLSFENSNLLLKIQFHLTVTDIRVLGGWKDGAIKLRYTGLLFGQLALTLVNQRRSTQSTNVGTVPELFLFILKDVSHSEIGTKFWETKLEFWELNMKMGRQLDLVNDNFFFVIEYWFQILLFKYSFPMQWFKCNDTISKYAIQTQISYTIIHV